MKTKYTFLNEGFSKSTKYGAYVGLFSTGIVTLVGSVLSGIAALIVRCGGSEKLRQKELNKLKLKIDVLKAEIKNLTSYIGKEHPDDKQNYYKKKINICKKELIKLLSEYEIVKSMSLEDLRKLMAKRTFAAGLVYTTAASVGAGIGSGIAAKYGYKSGYKSTSH